MRIVVVGNGRVGQSVTKACLSLGHEVAIASRTPDDGSGPGNVALLALDDSAASADVVVLAVPFAAVGDVVPRLGLGDGQILIDATNPFGRVPLGDWPSGGALVASLAGSAHVVKAFNTIGYEHMGDPGFPAGPALMPICGDDLEAVRQVAALAQAIGFEPVAIGGLDKAALTENAGLLWKAIVDSGQGRDVAFGLLHRSQEWPLPL